MNDPRPSRPSKTLLEQVPFAAHIEHAYTPRETALYGGGDHIVVEEDVRIGRIHRHRGDALCKPRDRFSHLSRGGEDHEPSCRRCTAIAERAIAGPRCRRSNAGGVDMSPATVGPDGHRPTLCEVRIALVGIDGVSHRLIWTHDRERSVSILVDRPEQGRESVERLVGAFWPEEGGHEIRALARDYKERYVKRPRTERIRPRPVEPADLVPPARRP